jgi:hypothetical protein
MTYLLLLIIIILLLYVLFFAKKTSADDDYKIPPLPTDRPNSKFNEPPRQPVLIGVVTENGTPVRVTIEPGNLILSPDNQAAWSSADGKIEIRFSPNNSPFSGASFTSARRGISLSGKPRVGFPLNSALNYIVLFTTADGFLLRQDATLTVSRERPDQIDKQNS